MEASQPSALYAIAARPLRATLAALCCIAALGLLALSGPSAAQTGTAAPRIDAELIAKLPIRERIITALRLRLTQAENEREALKVLMTWFAFPAHQALAAQCLYRTVDAVWHAIGDTSTDFNFYSKRAILAGVLAATVLYWLGDESEGAASTFGFLDRRIADVMAFEKAKGRAREWLAELPDPFRILRDVTARRDERGGEDTPGAGPGRPQP